MTGHVSGRVMLPRKGCGWVTRTVSERMQQGYIREPEGWSAYGDGMEQNCGLTFASSGARPKKMTPRKVAMAKKMLEDPYQSATNVADALGVSRATLYPTAT